jgi:hypothetical protein
MVDGYGFFLTFVIDLDLRKTYQGGTPVPVFELHPYRGSRSRCRWQRRYRS